jgi:hypothetical protein
MFHLILKVQLLATRTWQHEQSKQIIHIHDLVTYQTSTLPHSPPATVSLVIYAVKFKINGHFEFLA